MTYKNNNDNLTKTFSNQLLDIIHKKTIKSPRSYGFEYEFLPAAPLSLRHMEKLYEFLPTHGFMPKDECFTSSSGMYVTFEPGGQIEFCSPPLLGGDNTLFQNLLASIEETNSAIRQALGIEYLGTGHIPNRADAPLCLTTERYRKLHELMLKSGTKGREMMKGTASIHFHVVIRNTREIFPLFLKLRQLSFSEDFQMSHARRNIWDNTDPSRCEFPYQNLENISTAQQLIEELVGFALNAKAIIEKVPFRKTKKLDFESFLYHITTIFTDVRLNLKGPSVELRTLDSLPLAQFEQKWNKFVSLLENV